MLTETSLFVILLVCSGLTVFLFVYFIIVLSDLECDYLNCQQCCERLNMWMIPKMVVHIFVMGLLVLYAHWTLAAANFPLAMYMSYEVFTVPKGNAGVFEPTEIHNSGQLRKHMRYALLNLGYYLIFFFIYLYHFIISLLKGNPIEIINSHKEIDFPQY